MSSSKSNKARWYQRDCLDMNDEVAVARQHRHAYRLLPPYAYYLRGTQKYGSVWSEWSPLARQHRESSLNDYRLLIISTCMSRPCRRPHIVFVIVAQAISASSLSLLCFSSTHQHRQRGVASSRNNHNDLCSDYTSNSTTRS